MSAIDALIDSRDKTSQVFVEVENGDGEDEHTLPYNDNQFGIWGELWSDGEASQPLSIVGGTVGPTRLQILLV